MQLTWETPTLIWIDDAVGNRLAERLRNQWEPIYVARIRQEVEEVLAQHSIDRLITVEGTGWEEIEAVADIPHRAVLTDAQKAKTIREADALQGPLPGNVIHWMQTLDGQISRPVDTHTSLEWDENSEPLSRPVRGRIQAYGGRVEREPQIITSFSTAGGVGKTTTISVVARLLQEKGRKVAVVEADEEKAGILRLFGLLPASDGLDTIADIIWPDKEALQTRLAGIAVPISQRGLPDLVVYPLIGTLEGLQVPSSEAFADFLELLKESYDYILVDLGPRLRDDITIGTLTVANAVVLVYEPTEPNLDAAVRHMENIEQMKLFSRDKYVLLINKASNRGIKPKLMAQTLELPVMGVMQEETDTYHALANTGRISLPEDSPWRAALAELMSRVGDEDATVDVKPQKGSKSQRRGKLEKRATTVRATQERSFMRRLLGIH